MSPESVSGAPGRPADVVNEDIRALARRAWGRPFTNEERAVYDLLVVEWAAAVRGAEDVVEAA